MHQNHNTPDGDDNPNSTVPNRSADGLDGETAWLGGNDPLLQRLRAVDPLALTELDGPDSQRAQALLARVTSRPGDFTPYHESAPAASKQPASVEPHGHAAGSFQPSDAGPVVNPGAGARRRAPFRWPMVAAVAAALALLIGAVATLVPSNTEPALAVVTAAADDTANAETGRVLTAFELQGRSEGESGSLAGTVTTEFAGDDLAVSVDIDEARSTEIPDAEFAKLEQARTRLVDGVLYVAPDGTSWYGIEAPAMVAAGITQLTDTRTMLDQIETLVEVEQVGTATIDGADATHYRSEVDLNDQSLAESGWLPGQGAIDVDAEGVVEIELYVDDDGMMRRITLSGDVSPTDPMVDGAASFALTTDFVDLGSDITIEAPEGAEMQEFGPDQFDADD